jgi:hypothetical protein
VKRLTAALAITLVLAGCSVQDSYPSTTSNSLQEQVLQVSTLAADGSLEDAQTEVDALSDLVESAHDDGTLPDDRYADITAAIDSVSTDLTDQIAADQKAADDAAAAEQAAQDAQDAIDEQAAQDAADDEPEISPDTTGPGNKDKNKDKKKDKPGKN